MFVMILVGQQELTHLYNFDENKLTKYSILGGGVGGVKIK